MEWKNKLLEKCSPLKIELAETNDKLLFLCPKMPDENTKEQLIKILPVGHSYEFIEGSKQSTLIKIQAILQHFGIFSVRTEGRNTRNIALIIESKQSADIVDKIYEAIDGILRADGYFKTWRIEINGESKFYVPTIDIGAPRDYAIQKDDVLNLKIALETCTSLEEFLAIT